MLHSAAPIDSQSQVPACYPLRVLRMRPQRQPLNITASAICQRFLIGTPTSQELCIGSTRRGATSAVSLQQQLSRRQRTRCFPP